MAKKKYRKQRQHARKYKTGKKVMINKGVVYEIYKKTGTVSVPKKQIFQHLGTKKFETLGYLDFGKRGLERATMNYGEDCYSEMEDNPDFEVTYHTHPKFNNPYLDYINYFPSTEDIIDFTDSDDQAMVIVHQGAFTVITKTNKTKKMSKREIKNKLKRIESELVKKVKKSYKTKKIIKFIPEAQKLYNRLGLKLTFFPKSKKGPVIIPIKVVEESKKGRFFFSNPPNLLMGRSGFYSSENPNTVESMSAEQVAELKSQLGLGPKEKTRTMGKSTISKTQAIQEELTQKNMDLDYFLRKGEVGMAQNKREEIRRYKIDKGLI